VRSVSYAICCHLDVIIQAHKNSITISRSQLTNYPNCHCTYISRDLIGNLMQ